MDSLLAVIPARGGSKGIPRKVLQQVNGVPMLLRTLRTVAKAEVADAIVVSTDDPEIAALTRLWGFEALQRPAALADDASPLLEVARHAAQTLQWEGTVGLFQPTCPLLTARTCAEVVSRFAVAEVDWAITAALDPHLFWQDGSPLTPRVNRQVLVRHASCLARESGAVQLFSPLGLEGNGTRARLLIPAEEALDVDTWEDLLIARRAEQRRNILFRVAVGKEVGSGHLFRAIRLAEALHPHLVGITIEGPEYPAWALNMLDQRGLWWEGCESSFADAADLVVFDALDTTAEQVSGWRALGKAIATFEDEGPGRRFADLTINELLHAEAHTRGKYLHGPRYAVLRNEFAAAPEHAPERDRILVTFGGTDPARLNARVSQALAGYDLHVMVGPACDPAGIKGHVTIGGSMAEEMHRAALVVTGQGRTQYEAAAMGAPALLIAANEREARHVVCPGHLAMGLHAGVSDHGIAEAVHRLLGDSALLHEMSATARLAVDGRGVDRIVRRFEALLEEDY